MRYKLKEHNTEEQQKWGSTRKFLTVGQIYDCQVEKQALETNIIIDGKKFNSVCFDRKHTYYSFEEALKLLKISKPGYAIANGNWNGKNMYVAIQRPDLHSKMGNPYLYMKDASGKMVPWLASQQDLFSEKWYIIEV